MAGLLAYQGRKSARIPTRYINRPVLTGLLGWHTVGFMSEEPAVKPLCENGDGKPVHAKGLCQPCYRKKARRDRGLQKPGPKPDPSKPFSRHGGELTHHGKRPKCKHGHEFVEGSYYISTIGRRICLVCDAARTHCRRGHERTEETVYWWNGVRHCRVCRAEDAVWYHRLYKYGLSYDDLIEMLEEQEYACRLCPKIFDLEGPRAFCVDHDHNCCTGEYTCGQCVRGLLCDDCNKKCHDDIEWHERAIKYLTNYRLARKLQEESNV